ncbi:hypothetical protein D3C78_1259970 [compost metagenome]
MHPQSHPVGTHQILPVIREGCIQERAGVGVAFQGAQRRGVVCDHHGRPVMGLGEFAAQPVTGLLRLLDQVRRPDAAVVVRSDLAEIAQRLLRAQRGQRWVAGGGEVGPHRGAEEAHAADLNLIPIHDVQTFVAGGTHRLQRLGEVATVELVVARHVEHRAIECLPGPLDAPDAEVDIARQDDDISFRHLRREGGELVVQVGEGVNPHGGIPFAAQAVRLPGSQTACQYVQNLHILRGAEGA